MSRYPGTVVDDKSCQPLLLMAMHHAGLRGVDRETAVVEDGPPATDTERALVEILEALLDIEDVSRADGFFALGGDSVIAIQWAARAAESGLNLNPQMVFEHLTIAELAAAVDEAGPIEAPNTEEHAPMSLSGLDDDALAALQNSWPG